MNGSDQIYLLDANVLIEAHRRYYSFDLCPGFWGCLTHYCGEARLLSIDRVRAEISGGDELAEWVHEAPRHFFASTAEIMTIEAYAEIMAAVQASTVYTAAAKAEFARVADGWIAAHAYASGGTVVTMETYEPRSRRKVKLPNICREFGVPYTDTFKMLRELEVEFAWTP